MWRPVPGDIIFMHEQSRHNREVQPRDWSHHYFTPGDSDKCASSLPLLIIELVLASPYAAIAVSQKKFWLGLAVSFYSLCKCMHVF